MQVHCFSVPILSNVILNSDGTPLAAAVLLDRLRQFLHEILVLATGRLRGQMPKRLIQDGCEDLEIRIPHELV